MNWLDLARIGEECPHATEASFTAAVRAKWERVAAYIYAMYQTPLSASGTAEMAPVIADHGGVMPYPTLARWCTKDGALIFYGSDRAVYVMEKGEMAKRALEPMRSTTEPTIHGDRALCDALLDESIRDAADAAFEKRAYKGRTGGKDYYEQGEAGGVDGHAAAQSTRAVTENSPLGQSSPRSDASGAECSSDGSAGNYKPGSASPSSPASVQDAPTALRCTASEGNGSNPSPGAKSAASPSLPSWPKREQPKTLYDVVVDAREATAWRDAACLEIKRLQYALASRDARIEALERDHESRCDQVDKLQQRLDEIRVAVGGYFADDLVQHVRVRMTELGRLTRENDELRQRERDSNALIREHDARMKVALGYSPTDGDRYSDHVRKLRDDRDDKKKRIAALEADLAMTENRVHATQTTLENAEKASAVKIAALESENARLTRDLAEANMAIAMRWPSGESRSPAGETKTSEGAAIREDAGRAETDTTPRTATPSDASPAAWTEEQRRSATAVAATVAFWKERADDREIAQTCDEIAKHAYLFVQDPKEGERSAMREVRPETSASSEPLGSALSDDEIGSQIMNGLGGEKYDPSDLMPWERRVGKRARALFAKPAPVAVTRERIMTIIRRARHLAMETSPGDVNYSEERVADAVLSALSAPVSAEDFKKACEAYRDARDDVATSLRAALKSIGIKSAEGT